jgi:transcriptional regulator with XRE-family HTH domain
MTSKNLRFEDWLAEQIEDPEFVAEWLKQEPGYQVERLRMMRGLSQAELAAKVDTKQSSISRLERGERPPSLSFLRRVVEALDGDMAIVIRAGASWPKEEVRSGRSQLQEEIRGVGEEYAGLLEQAGVETVSDLAEEEARGLRERLVQVNGKTRVVERVPGPRTVGSWIEQARRTSSVVGVGA